MDFNGLQDGVGGGDLLAPCSGRICISAKRRRVGDGADPDSHCSTCNRRIDDDSSSNEENLEEFLDEGEIEERQLVQESSIENENRVVDSSHSSAAEAVVASFGSSNDSAVGVVASELLPAPLQSPRTPGPSSSNVLARLDEFGWQESKRTLTQRAGYLLNNPRMSDVRFAVGEPKIEIYAHKTILALGSPVFEAQFYGQVGSGAADVIELPDMEPDTFLLFLKYLYTDQLENSLDDMQLLNLLLPGKKYLVPHLVDKCSDILMTELKPENIFQILHHAQFYQLVKLEGACERYIDRNSEAIVRSEEFINLGKPILTGFLNRDGLNINEETLFQAVLRWANAECQRNSIDTSTENLRMALGDCLRLIRFPTMQKEEFASVFETTNVLSPEEACSVFVYMCKSPPNGLSPTLLFPTNKRAFAPRLSIVSRFNGDPLEHSLNYRSGEIYNYRINFKVDRPIFLKGVNIFSIRCGPQVVYGNRRDFNGALYLYEKGAPSYEGRKQFNKAGSLEVEESVVGDRRHYYPVMFDSEISIAQGKTYTVCVVVSVSSHSYPSAPLQTYVGTNERNKSCVMYSEDLAINFSFLGSSVDGSVGRFTSAQIPELIFCL